MPDPENSLAGRGHVGPVARALGFAGLLPQFAAVWLAHEPRVTGEGRTLAFIYGGLIFSFLGGMWWGLAMRRTRAQGALVVTAVLPSLLFLALAVWTAFYGALNAALIVLGVAIILTLGVDAPLFRNGEVPTGWMALRVPLSLGLGLLTIFAGLF
jgi:hypothetical protein